MNDHYYIDPTRIPYTMAPNQRPERGKTQAERNKQNLQRLWNALIVLGVMLIMIGIYAWMFISMESAQPY